MFSRYIKRLSAAAIAIATLALAGCTAEPNPPADTISTTAAGTTVSTTVAVTTAKPEETTAAKTEESTAKSEEVTTAKTEESTEKSEEITAAKTEETTAKSEEITTAKTEETEAAETTKKEEEDLETNNKPTLCGVEYRYRSSMTYGMDISIHITDKEIVYASYFPWEGIDNYDGDLNEEIIIEHQPIEPAQWADIERAVNGILPILGEGKVVNPSGKENTAFGFGSGFPSLNGFSGNLQSLEDFSGGLKPLGGFVDDIQPVDGVDSNVFRLTWRENGKETTYSYRKPGDRRFLTLIDVLCETVHPVGREIIWYSEPVIEGVYVTTGNAHSGKDSDFSFQCTPKKEPEGEWWFFANYGENKQAVSYKTTVNEEIWNRISEKLTELKVTEWEEGKYGNDLKLTLYYSDEKQLYFTPDKNNLNELRGFFLGIIEELKSE
ncbi:MAG: hypothetical protein ACI4J7_05665 [Ruminiclostridium sp.]